VYAEVKSAPGNVIIRWEYPDGWKTTLEMPIKAGELGYGGFTIFLGSLTQGKYYSWAIVIGYVEKNPDTHAVAHVGIPIRMIYPLPLTTSEPANATTTAFETVGRTVTSVETTSPPASSSEPDQTPLFAIVAFATMGVFGLYRHLKNRRVKIKVKKERDPD